MTVGGADGQAAASPWPILSILAAWLLKGDVRKLVLVITGAETNETLERWVFNVETDKEVVATGYVGRASCVLTS